MEDAPITHKHNHWELYIEYLQLSTRVCAEEGGFITGPGGNWSAQLVEFIMILDGEQVLNAFFFNGRTTRAFVLNLFL